MNKEPVRFSVSQAKTYKLCKRKWFLEKVDKLPVKFADSTTRGSILHEVLERWLLASEQGLDEKGLKVDLYPENWYIKSVEKTNKDTGEITIQTAEISFSEQAWIKRSVEDAISSGVLWRPPNRFVEYGFEEELLPATDTLPAVIIVGYIDLAYDWTIGDHKSCKNLNWVLNDIKGSDKYIGDDLQLLTYCYYWAKYKTKGVLENVPEFMDVEHYQYPFESKERRNGQGIPQTTKTRVAWTRVLENFENLKECATECRLTRFESTEFSNIEPNEESCGAYAGCGFRAICSGQESPKNYTDRINYQITPTKKPTKEQTIMADPFDELLDDTTANDTANTAAPEETKSPEPAEEKKAPATKFKVEGTREELIEKIGTLQKMQDDMGMDMSAQLEQLQTQVDKLDAEEKAELEAKAKAEADAKAKKDEELAKKAEEAKSKESSGNESDKTATESNSSGSVGSTSSDYGTQSSEAKESYQPDLKTKAKRSPTGIILCINGNVQGYSKYITIQKIFNEYAESAKSYCENNGKKAPDVFALRDAVSQRAEEIAEKLKGHVILANSITADTRPLCAHLAELDNAQVFIGTST